MSIVVIPEPLFAPPRNVVDVATPAGTLMQSVSVWRTLAGQQTALRSQPSAGFSSRTVYDYECPYGVSVTYGWQATYLDVSSLSTIWTETWASLASWTTSGASWSVSGGKLVWTAGDNTDGYVTRSVTPGNYRITFANQPVGVQLIDFGGFQLDLQNYRIIAGSQSATYPQYNPVGVWTIDVTPTSIVLTTGVVSTSLAASVQVTKVSFTGPVASMSYITRFGDVAGTGNGQTNTPSGVVASGGYVYVVDQGNHRVQKFTNAGVYVTQWGTNGTGNGQFSFPGGIAIDASGNLYVCDRGNHRVQKFTAPGVATNPHTYATQWGTLGTADGQFDTPNAITVDGSGNVFVVDSQYMFNRVQKFSNVGAFISKFGSYGTASGQFNTPCGIAVDAAGYIYVLDNTLQRVQKFTSAYAFVLAFGSQGTGNGRFDFPTAIAVDPDNTVYVTDRNRMQKFAYTGAITPPVFAGTIGTQGAAAGQFQNTTSISILPGVSSIYISDVLNGISRLAYARASIDDVTLYGYTQTVTRAEESAPVTLTPSDGWLIHPATPSLSFPLHPNGASAGIRTAGEIENESNATVHRILGSDTPVTTTNGNRAADRGAMTVAIATRSEELALKALLRDETPILINIPPSFAIDVDYAFYQVGDTTRSRLAQMPNMQLRDYYLPLTQVQSPIVTQQNVGWSYATVLITYAAYLPQLTAVYNTYADLATDNRNP